MTTTTTIPTETSVQDEPIPGQTTVEEQIGEAELEAQIKARRDSARARQSVQNKAYTQASARLRDAHRDEFDQFLAEESGKLGIEYKRRSTAAEREAREKDIKMARAKDKLEKLLQDNPELGKLVQA